MFPIDSVGTLLGVLKAACSEAELFRGQSQNWPLLPALGRYPHVVTKYDNWDVFHQHIMERFLRLGRSFFSELPRSDPETWVIAQHHGLPTRLLDATTNPLKALFFAVNNPLEDSEDGAFWAFSYTSWHEELDTLSAHWKSELVPFLPAPAITQRLTAQEGAFLSYPLPNHCNPLVPADKLSQPGLNLIRFRVPGEAKVSLRRELAVLGVQYRLLFPDLEGVARNIKLSELEP